MKILKVLIVLCSLSLLSSSFADDDYEEHYEKNHIYRSLKYLDLKKEQNPQTYIDRGFIDIKDDVAFKNSYLAANCFGHNYRGLQKGVANHPNERNTIIWFPKLYKNGTWNNGISDDELTITEICEIKDKARAHIQYILNEPIHTRIVFARVKSPLGDIMYRFKGEFELNKEKTNFDNGLIWERTSERVTTYDSGKH